MKRMMRMYCTSILVCFEQGSAAGVSGESSKTSSAANRGNGHGESGATSNGSL